MTPRTERVHVVTRNPRVNITISTRIMSSGPCLQGTSSLRVGLVSYIFSCLGIEEVVRLRGLFTMQQLKPFRQNITEIRSCEGRAWYAVWPAHRTLIHRKIRLDGLKMTRSHFRCEFKWNYNGIRMSKKPVSVMRIAC